MDMKQAGKHGIMNIFTITNTTISASSQVPLLLHTRGSHGSLIISGPLYEMWALNRWRQIADIP